MSTSLATGPSGGHLLEPVDGARHEDLETLWQERPRFPRPVMMGRTGLRAIWAVDRFNDMVNGSRRNARRGAREMV